MKKLLVTIVSLLLAVSMFAMTACSSVFDGNYQEMSKEEVAALRAETGSDVAVMDPNALTTGSGFKINMDVSMNVALTDANYMKTDMKIKMEFYKDGDKFTAKAEEVLKSDMAMEIMESAIKNTSDVNANFYYDGQTLYAKASGKTSTSGTGVAEADVTKNIDVKGKQDLSFDSVMANLPTELLSVDLFAALESTEVYAGVKVSKAEDGDNIKLKFTLDKEAVLYLFAANMGFGTSADIDLKNCDLIYVYNKTTKNLIGCKQVIDISSANGNYMKMSVEVSGATGSVSVPNEYKAFETVNDLFSSINGSSYGD